MTLSTLDHHWMPFSANRQFKEAPRMLTSANGMYYQNGQQNILDAVAGLWCVNAGHARPEIARAVGDQLIALDYAPGFQMGHAGSFRAAERLAGIAPIGADGHPLDRIFFSNSGSEAVDTALKMALAYQRAIGQASRTRLIGRELGYHGVGFGGISVGGLVNNRRAFSQLPGVDHLRHTQGVAGNLNCDGVPPNGRELAEDLERIVALHGAETIAAVIVEPVAGSAGVFPPPAGYLERLREISSAHGILLILDEVITGFGRVGTPFAATRFSIAPDIMTSAKGLTNGCIAMGATFASRSVHDAIVQGPPAAIEFPHGYTYSGHPVACAAAQASLDIYLGEGLFDRAVELEGDWQAALAELRTSEKVYDVRTIGLMAGIQLHPRSGEGSRSHDVFLRCLAEGMLVRVTGDTIALSPPLIITREQIGEIAERLASAIAATD